MKQTSVSSTKSLSLLFVVLVLSLLGCGTNENQSDTPNTTATSESTAQHGMGGGMMGNDHMMQGEGMMGGDMQHAMMSGEMGPDMMNDMRSIRPLLMGHDKITRRVEDLPNGVKTWTTSEDPQLVSLIQKHVRQMKERMKEKRPIRQMDPLFRELFDQADKINMEYENIENGIIVTETSADHQVTLLIKQHAHKAVSEFVQQGMPRAMKPTPLPEGYKK
jgi:hypothetical protein